MFDHQQNSFSAKKVKIGISDAQTEGIDKLLIAKGKMSEKETVLTEIKSYLYKNKSLAMIGHRGMDQIGLRTKMKSQNVVQSFKRQNKSIDAKKIDYFVDITFASPEMSKQTSTIIQKKSLQLLQNIQLQIILFVLSLTILIYQVRNTIFQKVILNVNYAKKLIQGFKINLVLLTSNFPILITQFIPSMLRFTVKGLNILTRTQNSIPFLAQRVGTYQVNKCLFASSKFTTEFNDKLLSGKYYEVLGYPPETNLAALTDVQVKRQYLTMVKKYHSDGIVDPTQKLQNEEITKCIIQAFDKISSERVRTQINKGIYDKIYKDEDEISMKIYGKKFDQIKYDLFKQGNGAKRAEFMEELEKIRKESKNSDSVRQKPTQASINFAQKQPAISRVQSSSDNSFIKFLIPGLGLLAVGIYGYQQQKQKNLGQKSHNSSKHTLGQDRIKEIEKKSTELHEKKLSDMINSFVDEQPPCLKYPQNQDPDQIEQLIEFTIGPDINIYEVSPHLLGLKQNLDKIKEIKSEQQLKNTFGQKYDPFLLTKIKPNSQITLSLEAERCLQNIYIKVKDVAEEIEETGKYTPPKIFFRYFGYVMFDIRQKPLSLANYRDTEYISLFDLFFDYYSPIPVKRHEFNEYVVGLKDDDMKMFGQVHINNKKIPERYIGRNDKVVVMRDEVNQEEKKNIEIWEDFYRKYNSIWTKGTSERIRTY